MADPQWGPVAQRPVGATSKKQRTRGQLWARRILIGLVSLVVLGLVGGTAVVGVGYATTDLPDANADFETATTFVYYEDGKAELGSFAVQNRQPLTLEEMPQNIKDAVVAAMPTTLIATSDESTTAIDSSPRGRARARRGSRAGALPTAFRGSAGLSASAPAARRA